VSNSQYKLKVKHAVGATCSFGAVRNPERRCIREVGVVGVGGVASIWSEIRTAENPWRSLSISLGAICSID
jgi:hypothetical protein